jgi:predicted site-specific integrase-resolvase
MFNTSCEESIKRVVVYTKVSSAEQVEDLSLDK